MDIAAYLNRIEHQGSTEPTVETLFALHRAHLLAVPFDHPVLLVELDERWIADVGFGDAHRLPLRLDEPREQVGREVAYRISPDGNEQWKLWERLENGEWEFFYAFAIQPCRLSDFVEACRYYETSPRSTFTRKRICSRATPDGHISLTDDRLIAVRNGQRFEKPLANHDDFVRSLNESFGSRLDKSFPGHEEERIRSHLATPSSLRRSQSAE